MTDDEVYCGPERRNRETLQMEAIEAIVERLMVKIITAHEVREQEMWSQAFPAGDPEAHRDYHQTKIDAAKAEQEFWSAIKLRVAETGIIGTLRVLIYLVLIGFGAQLAAKLGMLPSFVTWLGGK